MRGEVVVVGETIGRACILDIHLAMAPSVSESAPLELTAEAKLARPPSRASSLEGAAGGQAASTSTAGVRAVSVHSNLARFTTILSTGEPLRVVSLQYT
jgi:hypothetical protein